MTSKPRDQSELEGTLLPPVSAYYPPSSNTNTTNNMETIPVATAIPINYFDYNAKNDETYNHDIPIAPVLSIPSVTRNDSPKVQAKIVSEKAGYASDMGRIQSSQERDAILAANRKVYALNYHEAQRIEQAQKIAKRRVQEGFNMNQYFSVAPLRQNSERSRSSSSSSSSIPKCDNDSGKGGNCGYQISDYKTSSYTGGTYDTSYEYKSVYE